MEKIKKGTFVFIKNNTLSGGFFVSAKRKKKRDSFGFTSNDPEFLIEDIWSGKEEYWMDIYSTDQLSTDIQIFQDKITEMILKQKSIIQQLNPLSLTVSKKISIYEKNKKQSKSKKEQVKALANELYFYEDIVKEITSVKKTA